MNTLSDALPAEENVLTDRWIPLKPVPQQIEMENSDARFQVVVAGRRSGKTERSKRKLVTCAIEFDSHPDGRFIAAGPTQDQAKEIWWNDLKKMVPKELMACRPKESPPQTITLYNGARIQVMGMDRPERVDGSPVDGFMWDEFADSKPHGWQRSVRPAVSTVGRPGWVRFLGKPKGSGTHFHKLAKIAQKDTTGRWSFHTWSAREVLDPEEIEAMKDDLDEVMFLQEVEGLFASLEGRAYYSFDSAIHASESLAGYYDPKAPLDIAFDFNVDPGVAVISQKRWYLGLNGHVDATAPITMALGEVYIEQSSNTPRVCRKIIEDWGSHKGLVRIYGDPAGGNRSTQNVATDGGDYVIIQDHFRPVFKHGLTMCVAPSHPRIRSRVNAVNRRLKTANGVVRALVCPAGCPKLVEDLEEVVVVPGTNGEILKEPGSPLTHISDGWGYQIHEQYPPSLQGAGSEELV